MRPCARRPSRRRASSPPEAAECARPAGATSRLASPPFVRRRSWPGAASAIVALEAGGLFRRRAGHWEEMRSGWGALHVRALHETPAGELLVGAREGLFRAAWGATTLERLDTHPVRAVAEGAGLLVAGGEDGLFRVETGRITRVETPDSWIEAAGLLDGELDRRHRRGSRARTAGRTPRARSGRARRGFRDGPRRQLLGREREAAGCGAPLPAREPPRRRAPALHRPQRDDRGRRSARRHRRRVVPARRHGLAAPGLAARPVAAAGPVARGRPRLALRPARGRILRRRAGHRRRRVVARRERSGLRTSRGEPCRGRTPGA